MSVLNLKLTDAKRPLVSETRRKSAREVVLDGIQNQIALLSDSNSQVRKTVAAPPKPWWWVANDGTHMVQVRYGSSTVVELEAGKPTIVAGKNTGDLVSVLSQVADAVKGGKLDHQIDAAKAKAKRRKE